MNQTNDLLRLKQTLTACVSPFHCILEAQNQLKAASFSSLHLTDKWTDAVITPEHGYYVPIFDSSLIAFTVGPGLMAKPSLRMEAAHTDWPCLKLKPSPEVITEHYGKLNVEVYGGPILNTWMDRPLSMAGKVCITGASPFQPAVRFIDMKKPLLVIPNLAIHMNRQVNDGVKLNPQTDMLPLLTMLTGSLEKEHYFRKLLAAEAGCGPEDILDYEIYLYNMDSPAAAGLHEELFSSPRLDNITSVQAALSAIVSGFRPNGINVIALYDNEEVGSRTKQGALSAVTERVLEKLFHALGYDQETFLNAVMEGFLLSMDVAHAMHPNHKETCDIKNRIFPGDGIAIKMAASQSYSTDAACVSIIEGLCRSSQIPYKKFSNRSDIKGGSTLGALSSSLLSMRTVDIGVPLLAMHSARELMGSSDQSALTALAVRFFLA